MFWIIAIIVVFFVVKFILEHKYKKLEKEVLEILGFSNWDVVSYFDERVVVKSRSALEKYDDIKFFKENKEKLMVAENILKRKNDVATTLKSFLEDNEYKSDLQYRRLKEQMDTVLKNAGAYRICVNYISTAGKNLGTKQIIINQYEIDRLKEDPSLLMGKGEYNKYLKEQQKEALSQKQHEYYESIIAEEDVNAG